MKYDFSPILAPFGAHINRFYLRVSPITGDAVDICLVLIVKPTISNLLCNVIAQRVVDGMASIMEDDLREQAFMFAQDVCYWRYTCQIEVEQYAN